VARDRSPGRTVVATLRLGAVQRAHANPEEIMKAREIMTSNPACCTPDATAQEAALLMLDCDCGVIPVVEDKQSMRLAGVVTDRDLTVRGLAQGKGAATKVRELMTSDPSCCSPEDDLREVERAMADRQVRRVPIVDDRGCCVGVVAQADLARAAERSGGVSDQEVARIVEKISEPAARFGAGGATRQPEARL
jgi:CBS domain-containing protein